MIILIEFFDESNISTTINDIETLFPLAFHFEEKKSPSGKVLKITSRLENIHHGNKMSDALTVYLEKNNYTFKAYN